MTTSSTTGGANPCLSKHDGYICTIDDGHTGAHEAHDGPTGVLVAEWPDGGASRSTPIAESAELIEDPDEIVEPQEYSLRLQLGIRSPYFMDPLSKGNQHPDRRPCPSWCEMGSAGYQHEINPRNVLVAEHCSFTVRTLASCYGARPERHYGQFHGATLESWLESAGVGEPRIRIALRHFHGGEEKYEDRRLTLRLDDAQDLITTLQYLVAAADAAEELR